MAICSYCQQEMTDRVGCIQTMITMEDIDFDPIHWKSDLGLDCDDCYVPHGCYHHPGCGQERCPRCDGQLISCGCLELC